LAFFVSAEESTIHSNDEILNTCIEKPSLLWKRYLFLDFKNTLLVVGVNTMDLCTEK